MHVSVPGHVVVPLTSVGATLYGEGGNDTLNGGSGPGALYGGDGDDVLNEGGGYVDNRQAGSILDGGSGNDVIRLSFSNATVYGGSGDDLVRLGYGNATIDGGDGTDTVLIDVDRQSVGLSTVNGVTTMTVGTAVHKLAGVERIQFRDQLFVLGGTTSGTETADSLTGTVGPDTINGLGGDDVITPGLGSDTIDGGGGTDTLVLPGLASAYYFSQTSTGWLVYDGASDVDSIVSIEQIRFSNGVVSLATVVANSFDAYGYIAGYADLLAGYRSNPAAGYRHYITNGQQEGRSPSAFNSLLYTASNEDLIRAFGLDARASSEHYVRFGEAERRSTNSFDALEYIASNLDLAQGIGYDAAAGVAHYIQAGFYENRSTSSFNALIYGASNADLAKGFKDDAAALLRHYLTSGADEGRASSGFNPLLYGASNADLAKGLGDNADALLHHYLQSGAIEGRIAYGFDALAYGAANVDLARAFGTDQGALVHHYLQFGAKEDRAVGGFDSVGYLLSYGDLAGLTPSQARDHWLTSGAVEGRVGDRVFAREQTSHTLSGGNATGAVDFAGDHDWYQVTLGANQTVTIALDGLGSGTGTLGDGVLAIYDAAGRFIAYDNDAGPGLDARLTFTASAGGTYYLVTLANGSGLGTYSLNLATVSAGSSSATLEKVVGEAVFSEPAVQPFATSDDAFLLDQAAAIMAMTPDKAALTWFDQHSDLFASNVVAATHYDNPDWQLTLAAEGDIYFVDPFADGYVNPTKFGLDNAWA